MKKVTLFSLSLAAMLLAGCEKNVITPDPEPGTSPDDIVFSAELSGEATDTGASMAVSHNGGDRDTYYGFCYSDLTTGVQAAINQKIKELTSQAGGFSDELLKGKMRIATLTGLNPATSYRYVVFGLNEDGSTYGTPASCEFKTSKAAAVFTVELSGKDASSATVEVTSSGDAEDTWYCFATEDMTGSLDGIVAEAVKGLTDIASAVKSGNKSVTLGGLKANTSYRAVVTGLRTDGTVYGTPVAVSFTTTIEGGYVANPNWTVAYEGKQTTQDGLVEVISVTSSDTERYFIDVLSSDILSQYTIDEIAEASVAAFVQNYPFPEGLQFTYTESAKEPWLPFESGTELVAFAFGINESGAPTGKYAQSEKFMPEELQASEEYNKWLGKWTMKGLITPGQGQNPVEQDFTVTVSAKTPEQEYSVSFEGIQDALGFPALTTKFSEGSMIFCAAANVAQIPIEGLGTVTFGFYSECHYEGGAAGAAGDYIITGDKYEILKMTLDASGTTANGDGLMVDVDGLGQVKAVDMTYFGESSADGKFYTFGDIPMFGFPVEMTKVQATSQFTAKKVFTFNTVSKTKSISSTTKQFMRAVAAK